MKQKFILFYLERLLYRILYLEKLKLLFLPLYLERRHKIIKILEFIFDFKTYKYKIE